MNFVSQSSFDLRRQGAMSGSDVVIKSASGSGDTTKRLQERISSLAPASPLEKPKAVHSLIQNISKITQKNTESKPIDEVLYDALASFKIKTASVAMHVDSAWRDRLFGQLDSLLDADEWDERDIAPDLKSFTTFLRMLLLLRPDRRPGLAASSDGHLIAAWSKDRNRLTIECLPSDEVRWALSRENDGEVERAAGRNIVSRLRDVLAPYDPERWFQNGV